MENKFITIMDDAISNIQQDRDHWVKEVTDRMRAFRAKAASIEPHCISAMHSEMDSVCTANQRVREDDILLQNLYAIRSRMLKEVEA